MYVLAIKTNDTPSVEWATDATFRYSGIHRIHPNWRYYASDKPFAAEANDWIIPASYGMFAPEGYRPC